MEKEVPPTARPLKIGFDGPAKHFTDAIPIGNGRLGAMVWGGVSSELIQLNEDTLWTGVPGNYTNPNAPEASSVVRSHVDEGEYTQATAEAVNLLGARKNAYQLLGDIKLEFDDSHLSYVEETYYRELDLDTATALVKYSVGEVKFTREHFASNPDQALVMKFSGSKPGCLSFRVSLHSKLDHHAYVNGKNQIIMEGSCLGELIPWNAKENEYPAKDEGNKDPMGIRFSAVLDLHISDGTGVIHVLDDKTLKVEGSDWTVLRLAASSTFDGPFTNPSDSKRDPTSASLHVLESVSNLSYADLYARHLDDYQNLFHRVSLHLRKSSNRFTGDESLETKNLVPSAKNLQVKQENDVMIPTVDRILSFQSDEDPSLLELLFQFGRYLLISCSRPGTQVANLQGIWNKDPQPKWECAPHLNINLEMNYWPSLPCNLSECQEPLFDFIKSLSVNGSKTAQVNYKAHGWVVHHSSDIWAKSSADTLDPTYALWPMGGAWLCLHLWEHYNFTLEKDFLEAKAYPLLEGCASFLLDWLIEEHGKYLVTNPSTSPEHAFITSDGTHASVSYSSTMDIMIIKEVFHGLVSASEVLGRNEDPLVQKVKMAQARLRPIRIAQDGSVMEWAEDFKDSEVHHRHLSHLFGLFPGHTLSPEENPDLCKAAEKTLYKRGMSRFTD
ncbi:hypothetical protein K2173_002447 [Erythroxylum novogranatense]|uniref:Glycosyl hydrolase family 95 N-terminal domain-containing protein n=1 Tax=Erythroxylum novogranatense TaxID=1862640 RepID=A0AAV8TB53_9ROSI|nr:hypothetical protein K2173_002447 [Erythroxylum novogranatense]